MNKSGSVAYICCNMDISITGNIDSFQLSRNVDLLDIGLRLEFGGNLGIATAELIYRDNSLLLGTVSTLSNFAQTTKGYPPSQLAFLLQAQFGGNGFLESFATKGALELSMIKSVFMIFMWVENSLMEPHLFSLRQKIYNEFIIDYTGRPEPQKDIYFISDKYNTVAYQPHLTRLLELNLLNRCDFQSDATSFRSYFIPMIKPGVSRELFTHGSDFTGNTTYGLWKHILDDRDLRMRSWMNTRF